MPQTVRLAALNDFAEWRAKARALLLAALPPDEVIWANPALPPDLFSARETATPPVTGRKAGVVPPKFLRLAEAALCHSDPGRFALLYSLLWRLQKDRDVLFNLDDTDVARLNRRVEAVAAEVLRMKKELRFRRSVSADGHKGLAAWFEPKHYVLERVAPHFARDVAHEDWVIATPYRTAFWDGKALSYADADPRRTATPRNQRALPLIARVESVSEEPGMTFNQEIRPREARRRRDLDEPHEDIVSLADARAAVQGCRRCPLYQFASQAVFGEGPDHAEIMFVGEQPGDQEDLQGHPFVGPAGRVFDQALNRAGIARERTYVTNAVKHFKFVPRGRRRLHQKPDAGEISACRFWLNLELEFVQPRVVVALGATAAQSLLGRVATVSSLRGKPIELEGGRLLYVTVHPSYLLRIRARDESRAATRAFDADLRKVRTLLDDGDQRLLA